MTQEAGIDRESQQFLSVMGEHERLRTNRIPGVRSVLVVLCASGMVYDMESLSQKIRLSYPEAQVFFMNTQGEAIGSKAPSQLDLLIDLTGPSNRQGFFFAKKLRRLARVAIGRNAGLFRKRIYDRIYDERGRAEKLPVEVFERERRVQREVLALAGIALAQTGDSPADRGKTIALELPPMARL